MKSPIVKFVMALSSPVILSEVINKNMYADCVRLIFFVNEDIIFFGENLPKRFQECVQTVR
jgi:NAD-dependent SIR2 family protein deacetylase